ncbi:thioredoxin domain-containing protein [Candidatus Poribacteria bacterium]|nr:thioredoxin domain-containing protein [Candidatus Poribacteria bacterium]
MKFNWKHFIESRPIFAVMLGLIVVADMTVGIGLTHLPLAHAAEENAVEHELRRIEPVEIKNPDGTWKWTNHLIHETSPYLLLHAHNPVEWYTWGPEALERAKTENKPIFLSIGYSTCYWCHVMERKVFSNPEIAKLMNEKFINIKVDREERPDIDEIYMTATQIMTGSGGWPNSVFLTPDLLPFYAGTYFPPTDSFGRPGFPRVLQAIHDAWMNQRKEVIDQAHKITAVIEQATSASQDSAPKTPVDRKLITSAVEYLQSRYNAAYGGFGGAPKFPSPTNLEFLLNEYQREASEPLLKMVTHTLDMMAYGGMYEQLGGGFHRYSTDDRWLVPHFEKMLYDNGQLAKVYLQAYHLTKDPLYRRVAEEIFAFVSREMTSADGGFYSALDAEVDAVEGKYYVWTKAEIQQVLGKQAKLFMKVYGVDKGPNFEGGTYILYLPSPMASVAKEEKKSEAEILKQLEPLKAQLLAAREKRKHPLLDTKVITSWNGLMIDAFAYGYEVLGEKRYLDTAQKGAEFILKRLKQKDGQLMRTYKDGVAKYDGYLDDYAFLVRGLLGLYQATGEKRWLSEAQSLTDAMIKRFWDNKGGGFYFTLADQEHLVVRTKNPYDSAIPSGNAVAANNLLTLARLTGNKEYLLKVQRTLERFAGMMAQSPSAFMHILLASNRYLSADRDH